MDWDMVSYILDIFKIWNILGEKNSSLSLAAVLYTCRTPRHYVLLSIYATEAAHMPRNERVFV